MLQQLSDQIRQHAAEAKAKADATDDPVLKAEFLDMEKRWLTLARSYGFTEGLEDFTTANLDWRRKFDERLRAKTGSAPDASLRQNAEQVLWLASVVESSDDAIITRNLEGIITSWNKSAERLFGYTAEEVIGKPVLILFPPERRDEERAILDRIKRGERIDHYETIRQ